MNDGSLPRRRLLAGGLAGLSVLTVPAAGCAPGEPTGGSGAEGPTGSPVDLGPETAGIDYPDPYTGPRARTVEPFGDPTAPFRVVVRQDAEVVGDWARNGFTRWLEQRTGVKIDFQTVLVTGSDGSTDLTKINAILASGDLPDAFLGIPLTDDQISLYGQQGALTRLDPYLETQAPQLKQAMTDYPDLRTLSKATDGGIYQFRGLNDCFQCRAATGRSYINQAYLERVGAEVPTDLDQFAEVLRLFRDRDPSGTGGMIPFGAGVNQPIDGFVMNAFLYNPGGTPSGGWLALDGDRVAFQATKPEWRAGLRYLRSLADEKLITPEAFTMTDDAMRRVGNQGRFGAVRAFAWITFVDVTPGREGRWTDYVALPPLAGPDGVRYAAWDHYSGIRDAAGLVITSACRSPETLVRWADAQLELEATLRAYGGTPGENWDWAKPADRGIDGRQAIWDLKEFPPPAGQSWSQNSVMYRSNDFRLSQRDDPTRPTLAGRLYRDALTYQKFQQPKEHQLPPLIFDEADAARRADLGAALAAAVRTATAEFSLGRRRVDDEADWQAYLDQLAGIGVQDYVDLHQRAYETRPR
ncbi:hypothetical protein [Microlunatus sp. GCM10028923]|uniref:hypothetical protein n=1 Tax=Microlunatus sp. GCM10028923 TaxID=3273400 RepID=UPI00362173A9